MSVVHRERAELEVGHHDEVAEVVAVLAEVLGYLLRVPRRHPEGDDMGDVARDHVGVLAKLAAGLARHDIVRAELAGFPERRVHVDAFDEVVVLVGDDEHRPAAALPSGGLHLELHHDEGPEDLHAPLLQVGLRQPAEHDLLVVHELPEIEGSLLPEELDESRLHELLDLVEGVREGVQAVLLLHGPPCRMKPAGERVPALRKHPGRVLVVGEEHVDVDDVRVLVELQSRPREIPQDAGRLLSPSVAPVRLEERHHDPERAVLVRVVQDADVGNLPAFGIDEHEVADAGGGYVLRRIRDQVAVRIDHPDAEALPDRLGDEQLQEGGLPRAGLPEDPHVAKTGLLGEMEVEGLRLSVDEDGGVACEEFHGISAPSPSPRLSPG